MGRMPPKVREKKPPSSITSGDYHTDTTVEFADDPLASEEFFHQLSSGSPVASGSGLQTINLSELVDTVAPGTSNVRRGRSRSQSQSPQKKKPAVVSSEDEDDDDDDEPAPPPPKPRKVPLPSNKPKPPPPKPKVILPSKFKNAPKPSTSATKSAKPGKPLVSTKGKKKISSKIEHTNASEDDEEEEEEVEVDEERLVSERKKFEEDGRNIFAVMNPEDTNEFLDRLQQQCPPLDRSVYISREKAINWGKVAFGAYGEYQCKCLWFFLRTHARRHRILFEVVSEVKLKLTDSVAFQFKLIESMPGFPQKPPTAGAGFHVYNRERWNAMKENTHDPKDLPNFIKFQQQNKEEYNCLSSEEKQKYDDMATLAQAEYERQVKAFYAENPGVARLVERLHKQEDVRKDKLKRLRAEKRKDSREAKQRIDNKLKTPAIKKKVLSLPNPFTDAPQPPQSPVVLFIQAKLNRIDPPPISSDIPHYKNRFLKKWKRLGVQKKVKWIDYCISLCEEYLLDVEKYQEGHPGYTLSKGFKIKQLLTKDELTLWESEHGKPQSPKGTIFDLFLEELIQSDATVSQMGDSERESLARNKWSELDWYHKEMYRMKFKISVVEYKKLIQNFFSGLPEFMKDWCRERIPKRFHKICTEIDTVPPDASTLPTESTGKDHETNQPPKKKKKKAPKNENEETPAVEEPVQEATSSSHHEDHSRPVGGESAADTNHHHVFEEPKPASKKRKRKTRDPEFITGDIFSDSQSESQTDGEGERRRPRVGLKTALLNSSVPIYQQNVTEDIKNELHLLKGRVEMDEKFSEVVRHQVDLMEEADEKTVHHVTEAFVKKHKRTKYPTSTKVTQRDIFHAVRGIFDGRSHLGYDFSAYYYYAKHVASQSYWINFVNSNGLEKCALKMIKTFLVLNDYQQEVFLEESARFHMSQKHKSAGRSQDMYPGEPRPPARSIGVFYRSERKRLQKKFPDINYPEFTELDPMTQGYYMKKLYHETKLYMRRYDMYIKNMTPNDLVAYAVFKARNWEKELYMKSTIKNAIDEYIFPLCRKESKLDFDEEPTKAAGPGKTSKKDRKQDKKKKNPFCDDSNLTAIAKKLPAKQKRIHRPRKINPLDMKLAECQRKIKQYADMNIVIEKRKTKRGCKTDLTCMYKRAHDHVRLKRMLTQIRQLEKKAKLVGVSIEESPDTETATGSGEQSTSVNKDLESQILLNEEEKGQGSGGDAGQSQTLKTKVQGLGAASRRRNKVPPIKHGSRTMVQSSVNRARRVVQNAKVNKTKISTAAARPEYPTNDWKDDDVSDTEVKFMLYPRVRGELRRASNGRPLTVNKTHPGKYSHNFNTSIENWRRRRDLILHRAKKYFYPIDDIIEKVEIKKPSVKYTYNSSTQTDYVPPPPPPKKYISRATSTPWYGIRRYLKERHRHELKKKKAMQMQTASTATNEKPRKKTVAPIHPVTPVAIVQQEYLSTDPGLDINFQQEYLSIVGILDNANDESTASAQQDQSIVGILDNVNDESTASAQQDQTSDLTIQNML